MGGRVCGSRSVAETHVHCAVKKVLDCMSRTSEASSLALDLFRKKPIETNLADRPKLGLEPVNMRLGVFDQLCSSR
jgi:hypothetical protein